MATTIGKLVAIVGPTAAGKTGLAMSLAERFDGEIVCADSRTVYRGMDIGTAKPTVEEQARVRHHLLDVADPDENLSAAAYKEMAQQAIHDIRDRGRVPILVGGSGLYVYSVLYDYTFPAGPRTAEREELERRPLHELVAQLELSDQDRAAEIDVKNARRVIRALETVGQPRERAMHLSESILLLGLRPAQDVLNKSIEQRTIMMFEAGLVGEVERLVKQYGPDLEVFNSPGYAQVRFYLTGDADLDEARELVCLHTRQMARRQWTWFKRNSEIRWLDGDGKTVQGEAVRIVREFLAA